jgi:hypothetical protein
VSCTAADACTAVGNYEQTKHGEIVPMAERWDGNNWTIQPTPFPYLLDYGGFSGAACATATSCAGVGYYDLGGPDIPIESGPQLTLAERWTG